ncbi:MAG: bifunctional metallophosphatase/5'-nucleotidase [Bacteroidales bacterium]|nr:bifunctional metallophosphatase/5'-nucleotidase [Bacteroidales bacterium]
MTKYFSGMLTAMMLFFATIGFSQDPEKVEPVEVIILHTNDMHAKIDNFPKLAYLADSLRKIHPYVFLVSAGDNFTGNPVVDMIPDKGYPMIDLMNHCGFDVSCFGNHEFDLGQDFLNKRIGQANFPFICCNLDASGAILKQPKPYVVLNAGPDITLAFLGLIQLDANGLPSSHPSKMTGIRFSDGVSKALDFRWLKEKYNILILLTHLGVEEDVRLADSLPEADLIIGGHSHTLIEKSMTENGVRIVQAGSNLKYVGKTVLTIEKGKITGIRDEVVPLSAIKNSNKEMEDLVKKYNENEEFSKVVGVTETKMEGAGELGSLMTDALTDQLKVDFAFQNNGGIRIQSIEKGNITLKDIYKLDPFGNQVVIFKMKADEIKSLICYAYQLEKGIDLQVSGMTYSVKDNGNHQCGEVAMKLPCGKKLDPSKEYSVAMNNYIAATYKFDHRDPGNAASVTTAEALINFLKSKKTVDYSGVNRALLKP